MRNLFRGLVIACTLLPLSLQADDCAVDWEVVSPKFETNQQRAVIYANNQYLSVGDGRVLRSTDGVEWSTHATKANLNDVVWLGNKYLGTSRQGIWTSLDGINWTLIAADVRSQRLVANGQTIVTFGSGWDGLLWYSTNGGNTWTQQSLGEGVLLKNGLWDGQQFVLESTESNAVIFWLSPDGSNWQKQVVNGFDNLEYLTFNGTDYLAFSYSFTEPKQNIIRSSNLVDWQSIGQRDISVNNFSSLTWIDGYYIASSVLNSSFAVSVDGINWDNHVVPGYFYGYVDVATNGQNYVATINTLDVLGSNNLRDWYSVVNIAPSLTTIAASTERFVAVSTREVSEFLTSTDGSNWVSQNTELNQYVNGVTWFKDRFYAWGAENNFGWGQNPQTIRRIYHSEDGTVWTQHEVSNDALNILFGNFDTRAVAGSNDLLMFNPNYDNGNLARSTDGLNWELVTLNAPTQDIVVLAEGIWDGAQFVFVAFSYPVDAPEQVTLLIATSSDGQQWQFREINMAAEPAPRWIGGLPSIAYNGTTYVLHATHTTDRYGIPAIYTSTDLTNWNLQQPKIPLFINSDGVHRRNVFAKLYWTGHEFLLAGNINLRSKDGVTWEPVLAPSMRSVASNGEMVVGVQGNVLALSRCQPETRQPDVGYRITEDLYIRALINPDNQYQGFPYIEARWQQGGEATTARGDRVIWGYFYADSQEVSWGSPDNPELFVKIWFDVSGRIDVNYFHVSVPNIDVYTRFNGNLSEPDQYSRTGTTDRYVRHFLLPDGRSDHEIRQEDGISAEMPVIPASTPNLYQMLEAFRAEDRLQIGAQIETETVGTLDSLWFNGGEAETDRGDLVAWGYFYADPAAVDWGDPNNPEIFVKIWFDVNGRIDANYFHVSVPNINLFSDYTKQGRSEQQYGLTHTEDRYTRHEFWQN